MKSHFSPEHWEHWEPQKQCNQYKKGDPIFTKGDPIVGLNIVLDGVVELFHTGLEKRPEVVRFAGKGDVFGHVSVDREVYPSSAIAKELTVVCSFHNDVVLEMHSMNPKFAFHLISFYSRNHNKTVFRLLLSMRMNLREKVADALIYLSDNFGLNHQSELKDCFNREDIASLANTTTEQVSRQLTDFEKEKLIEKRTRKIAILDLQKLKKITHYYYYES